jgi:hypothetical protein
MVEERKMKEPGWLKGNGLGQKNLPLLISNPFVL